MKVIKRFADMNAAELAEATKLYDAMVIDKTRPLNSKEQKLWQQARRGRGRPKVGQGARKVSISLEGNLLRRADALARKKGLNRSELIAAFLASGLQRRAV